MKLIALPIIAISLTFGNLLAEVEVVFENPEEYRDIDYGDNMTKRGIKVHLPRLEKHIVKQAKRYLEEGQSLSMKITDIDLAGEYEPWRSIDFDDIRIVKTIYPPRISFSFELTDEDGNVLKSGEEKIVDMNFEYKIRINYSDDLFYEKAMITDWFRRLNKK